MSARKTHEEVVEYVRVKVKRGKTGLYYATSEDLQGLFVAARTTEALQHEIQVGITALYEALGKEVTIVAAQPAGSEEHKDVREGARQWVAIPAGLNPSALAHC